MRGWRRYKVERCDEGGTLVDGPEHTWDIVDRTTGHVVRNVDTRQQARDAAHILESEAIIARLRQPQEQEQDHDQAR